MPFNSSNIEDKKSKKATGWLWSRYKDPVLLLSLIGLLVIGLIAVVIASGFFVPVGISLFTFGSVVSALIWGVSALAISVAIGGLIGCLIAILGDESSSLNDNPECISDTLYSEYLPGIPDMVQTNSRRVHFDDNPSYTSIFKVPLTTESSNHEEGAEQEFPSP